MANLRDIRRRIKSVKNTAQITRAMQLVAAAKMKKAQDQALAGREYADQLNQVLVNLKENVDEESHPLLQKRDGEKTLTLVISTDNTQQWVRSFVCSLKKQQIRSKLIL